VRAALALAAIVVALTLQTTIAGLGIGGAVAVDFVLVVVVYVGLTMGPIAGLAAGTVAGLAQDALSSGILGMGDWQRRLPASMPASWEPSSYSRSRYPGSWCTFLPRCCMR
jgi:hypothetical protein